MTNNNRMNQLLGLGYSTREAEETIENETSGTHFANALAFVVESINDDHFLKDIEELDIDTMLEFADMYNFSPDALTKAIEAFRKAAQREVTGTR